MLHATTPHKARKGTPRKVRFVGITSDAKALKVNRVTLYRVLTGEWNLPGLRSRYEKLKGGSR